MVHIRPATIADAEAMSDVRRASISELCTADHLNDEKRIADWLSMTTPDSIRALLKDDEKPLLVAVTEDEVVGIGCFHLISGSVLLNYVAPTHRFRGVSTALLTRMEKELVTAGFYEVKLTSTVTAQKFYLSRGYEYAGEGSWDWGYPMVKQLPEPRT